MRAQFPATVNQIALITFLLLLIFAYWIALPGPFLLDDFSNLPQTRLGSWSLAGLIEASISNTSGPLGRPIPALTFGLNYLITGDDALGFKVVNLAIHAANACLIFLLFRTLATVVAPLHPAADIAPNYLALAVAILWALHPLHMSTVMYVVQRMSLLSTFFVLASMNCYVNARLNSHDKKKLFRGLSTASLTFGILALFSKENSALLIPYLVLVEWSVLRHMRNRKTLSQHTRRIMFAIGSLVALMIVYPITSRLRRLLGGYEFRDFSLKERLLTQPGVIVEYLGHTLFPRISQMGLYFDDVKLVRDLDASFVWPLMLIILLAFAFFALLRRSPLSSLGIGLFLVSHLVESTFLPLELKFEHRNYFGSIGIVAALIFALGTRPILLNRPYVTFSLFVALTAVLTGQTYIRSHNWTDELTFNSHEIKRAPGSKRAHSALAISLSRVGRSNDALAEVQKIISLYPDDTHAPLQLFQICALASSNCRKELEGAYRALNGGRITINTITILGELEANYRAGLIKGLSRENLADLISLAARSPNLHLPSAIEASLQLHLSEAFLEAKEYRKAILAILQSVALDPANTAVLTRAAEINAGVGKIEDAEHILNLLTTVSPDTNLNSERILAVKRHLEIRHAQE